MVAGLDVRDARIAYGKVTAVDGVSLQVPPGSVVGLLGPSGSGKSTLLRGIAGLEPLVGGSVSWDGEDLVGVKVFKRNFGMVFQDAQLFPTMSVGRNIAYGLGKLGRAEQRARVEEMLDLVGLPGYADRRPTELSGGQAQRVALARSLAPSPRALLLDEPLSALDTGLRRRLAEDLSRILRETHTTAVYVTHDHQEAYTIADRVAILAEGRLLQLDDPEALRTAPASREVAAFLGARAFITESVARQLGWQEHSAAARFSPCCRAPSSSPRTARKSRFSTRATPSTMWRSACACPTGSAPSCQPRSVPTPAPSGSG